MTLVCDTHAFHWWTSEPERLSPAAGLALSAADEIVISVITWCELAWLAERGRIGTAGPIRSWIETLAGAVRTIGLSPRIAATAASLPLTFPSDPADRLIYATAIEHGWPLVSKDRLIHEHAALGPGVIW